LCSRLFEVTGARSTHASLRLDRHWRNLRTQSLHDPVDYRIRELGEWALKQNRRHRVSIPDHTRRVFATVHQNNKVLLQ